jgi:hypothetical protein
LQARLQSKDRQINNLIIEQDKYREAFACQALQQQFHIRGSPAPENASKSVKLPDPLLLTDGKNSKFKDWLSRMKNKLTANTDYYSTEALRMAYIEN